MASRTSGMYSQEQYTTTYRGRELANDIGWEMFPEKLEKTDIYEDPNEMYDYRRDVLKDLTPDRSNLMAYEETRRDKHSREFLNLRSGGARVTTDPWANEGFDTQFHDSDPRGWSTEQPWQEYRRLMQTQMDRLDFKDDGDYSVPSSGLHPNTMYSQIRAAQDWVKARLKIFSTSKDNFHNGGIGKYKYYDRSSAEKVDFEETSVNIDQRYDSYENRRNKTDILSDKIALGSKALRVNTTTDHEVAVSAYGKLMKHVGLIPHETQLRMLEDDTRWGKEFKPTKVSKPLAIMMAAEANRENMQNSQSEKSKFVNEINGEMNQRGGKVLHEIVSLLGFTENEIKFLKSEEMKNNKTAKKALANLYELTEMLHALPANVKLTLRDELALKSGGARLRPSEDGGRDLRNSVILNPKIRDFMIYAAGGNKRPEDTTEAMRKGIADSEGKLNNIFANSPLFIYKNSGVEDLDVLAAKHQSITTPGRVTATTETAVASFKSFAKTAMDLATSSRESITSNMFADSIKSIFGMNLKKGETMGHSADINTTKVDNKFGENLHLDRRVGRIGSKHMVRDMETDTHRNEMSDATSVSRRPVKPVRDVRNL